MWCRSVLQGSLGDTNIIARSGLSRRNSINGTKRLSWSFRTLSSARILRHQLKTVSTFQGSSALLFETWHDLSIRVAGQKRCRPGVHCATTTTTLAHRFLNSSTKQNNDNNDETRETGKPTKSGPIINHSDPPILTWVDQYLPAKWQPYARLARMDRPIGTWLLLWPCFWSTAVAATALPDPTLLALFGVGAFVMRGAGCTINDLWDRDIDAQVTRTATRPLASGEISTPQAIAFLAAQLLTGLAVLLSLPNTEYCFLWGAASLPLVAVYPTMKRFFPYPQLFLGLTFNWGAWMGWAAVHGSMDYSIIAPLYSSGVTWTLVYDTIYAHQDKHDDAKLGLQSTALTFGKSEKQQKAILYSLASATWLQWLLVGQQAGLAAVYSAGASASFAHLLWQIHTADLEEPHNLAARFRSNSTVGAMMFGSLVAGSYFA